MSLSFSPLAAATTRGFVLGAVTVLSLVWVTTKRSASATTSAARISRRRRRRNEQVAATETTRNDKDDNAPVNVDLPSSLLDSPDLDLRLLRKAEAVLQYRSAVTVVVERCVYNHNYSAILRTAEAIGLQRVYIIDPPTTTLEDEEEEDDDEEGTNNNNNNNNHNNIHNKLKNGAVNVQVEAHQRALHHLFAQNATEWLTLREFASAEDCLQTLRHEEGYQVWATDLSQEAVPLTAQALRQALSVSQQPNERGDDDGDDESLSLPPKLAIVFGTEAVGVSQYMLDHCDMRVYLPLYGFADSLNLSVAAALVLHQILQLDPSLVGNLDATEKQALRQEWFPKLAQQRLLTSRQKKQQRKLQNALRTCDTLQAKRDNNILLTPEQELKLAQRQQFQLELQELQQLCDKQKAQDAVSDWIAHPPAPLTDLRRADAHRITFAGRGARQKHKEHWKDMAATAKHTSPFMGTASVFRERMKQQQEQSNNNNNSSNTTTIQQPTDHNNKYFT